MLKTILYCICLQVAKQVRQWFAKPEVTGSNPAGVKSKTFCYFYLKARPIDGSGDFCYADGKHKAITHSNREFYDHFWADNIVFMGNLGKLDTM